MTTTRQHIAELSPEEIELAISSGDDALLLDVYRYLNDPYFGFTPRPDSPEEFDEQTSALYDDENKFVVILGGTGCIAAEQEVYDAELSQWIPVGKIKRPFLTWSYNEKTNKKCLAIASKPFQKGVADLYEVCLSNGRSFISTLDHRVKVLNGWKKIREAVSGGYEIVDTLAHPQKFDAFHLPSISDIAQQEFRQDADRSTQTIQDFQSNYFVCHCPCDAQLRFSSVVAQDDCSLLDDARERTRANCCQGGPACESKHSRFYPALCPLSTMDFSSQATNQPDAFGTCVSCTPSTLILDSFQADLQYPLPTDRQPHTSDASFRQASQFYCELPRHNLLRIVSLRFIRRDYFYDFTVNGTHCYVMKDGAIHHNSGKTATASVKTATYLRNTKPFREYCPFWIIGETKEMVMEICWVEKLSKLIPEDMIHSVVWDQSKKNWPSSVLLKHPDDPAKVGWAIEFKSYAQGREQFQGHSIGGFWFNEECPLEIVEEVIGRCRDYDSPGWADFTPLKIKSPEWAKLYNKPPKSWRFYHLNTKKNTALGKGWYERFISGIPEDMIDTRTIGTFGSLRGQVYKEWRWDTHVIKKEDEFEIPADWMKYRGIDFGYSDPYVCLWIAQDHDKRWYVYDEYYETQQLHDHHAKMIKLRPWPAEDPTCRETYSDHDAQERAELMVRGIQTLPANKNIHKGIDVVRRAMMIKGDRRPSLYVFERCKHLIEELPGYRWMEGTDKRNPNQLPYDVDNHCLPAGTMIATSSGFVPIESVKVSDAVWTRSGLQQVTFSGQTGVLPLRSIELSNGTTLKVTDNHLIFVEDVGWIPSQKIVPGQKLISMDVLNSSFTKAENTVDTQTAKYLPSNDTLSASSTEKPFTCIGKSGPMRMEQSRTATIFTTLTTTIQTIAWKIFNLFADSTTLASTGNGTLTILQGEKKQPASSPLGKIRCTLGKSYQGPGQGYQEQRRLEPKSELSLNALANIAATPTRPKSEAATDFVLANAERTFDSNQESTTLCANASVAESTSKSIATPELKLAAVTVLRNYELNEPAVPVYDLTVDTCHEFFANGILVHNCLDALRYVLASKEMPLNNQLPKHMQKAVRQIRQSHEDIEPKLFGGGAMGRMSRTEKKVRALFG